MGASKAVVGVGSVTAGALGASGDVGAGWGGGGNAAAGTVGTGVGGCTGCGCSITGSGTGTTFFASIGSSSVVECGASVIEIESAWFLLDDILSGGLGASLVGVVVDATTAGWDCPDVCVVA